MKLVNATITRIVRSVGRAKTLEQRFGWLAFPGLIRGIAIIHFVMYFLIFLRPESASIFYFDWEKILAGEPWRLVSFIFLPPILGASIFGALFMFFILMISFMISDSLESAWGSLRTSVYCYGLFLCQLGANIMISMIGFSGPIGWGGILFYEAVFFAFATLFPRYEFRLMLLFPVPVFILAIITAAIAILMVFPNPFLMLYGAICFLPYLVWAVPMFFQWSKTRSAAAARRASSKAKAAPAGDPFHRCESCGATELSHPDRFFRVTSDDAELCSECLGESPGQESAAEVSERT